MENFHCTDRKSTIHLQILTRKTWLKGNLFPVYFYFHLYNCIIYDMKNIGKSEIRAEKREDSWKIFTFEIWEDFFKKSDNSKK